MNIIHPLKPIYDKNSIVLILGSFPSIKSRENNFYYGNPKNKFWKVIEIVFEVSLKTNEEKKQFLLNNHIALFDVIKSCEITGSSDNTIKNVIPNDILKIIKQSKIKYIFTNGNKAHELYQKYILKQTNIEDIKLLSTSPANCKKDVLENLIKQFTKIKKLTK